MAPLEFSWIRRTLMTAAFAVTMTASAQSAEEKEEGWRKPDPSATGDYIVDSGSKIPLSLINSVSTKHSVQGDRVYLETVISGSYRNALGCSPGTAPRRPAWRRGFPTARR